MPSERSLASLAVLVVLVCIFIGYAATHRWPNSGPRTISCKEKGCPYTVQACLGGGCVDLTLDPVVAQADASCAALQATAAGLQAGSVVPADLSYGNDGELATPIAGCPVLRDVNGLVAVMVDARRRSADPYAKPADFAPLMRSVRSALAQLHAESGSCVASIGAYRKQLAALRAKTIKAIPVSLQGVGEVGRVGRGVTATAQNLVSAMNSLSATLGGLITTAHGAFSERRDTPGIDAAMAPVLSVAVGLQGDNPSGVRAGIHRIAVTAAALERRYTVGGI